MRKRAFTLLELVFVIVIIGIMAGVASSAFKPHYLIDDTNFVSAKIKEAQFLGVGYDHLDFGGTSSGYDATTGCIEINKGSLQESASNTHEINYKIHTTFSGSLDGKKICFDSLGRPHKDDFDGELLSNVETLTLSYDGEDRNISLQPITGYLLVE
jgi:prepilin-type N-terminal cleavage/methylation domain-containing protein